MATLTTDPFDWLLDTGGDLVITSGDLVWARGLAAVAQDIRIVVQMIMGEWFANLDEGIAYFNRDGVAPSKVLFGERFNEGVARDQFTTAILSVPNVTELQSLTFNFDRKTRFLSVTWKVGTTFGDTITDTLSKGA